MLTTSFEVDTSFDINKLLLLVLFTAIPLVFGGSGLFAKFDKKPNAVLVGGGGFENAEKPAKALLLPVSSSYN